MRFLILLSCFCFLCWFGVQAQSIPAGQQILEEYIRRQQVLGILPKNQSFSFRPVVGDFRSLFFDKDTLEKPFEIGLMPITTISRWNSNRPYGWNDFSMIPSAGIQQFVSAGIFGNIRFIHFQIQPELVLAQNSKFQGFFNLFNANVIQARFHYWNYGDFPERFGESSYNKILWGQSSLLFRFGVAEIGVSTKNIWWGPGQWNSLTFSNNAPGFPHLTLNSTRPVKTFLGNLDFQLLIGRLEDSGFQPTQFEDLNRRYFRQFVGDWRYLNALMFSYSPKWIPNFNVGLSRTFQRYSQNEGRSFRFIFPVFEGVQKINFFTDGNAVEYDADGYDQQFTVFSRYYNKKAKAEIYFEYGKRDHPLNWRELILNPEHARAYIVGFQKFFDLPNNEKIVQVRSEITHQQESVNRFIRYGGLRGGNSWHTHYQARGFANFGQPLGVGIGTGSNIQILEVSLVEKFNKMGIFFERLENHQDFYYRAFGQQKEHQPWIDLSVGFLFDKQWNNLLLSSKLQLINGRNYQWQLHPNSTPDFPKGQNLFSVHAQTSLIYIWNQPE